MNLKHLHKQTVPMKRIIFFGILSCILLNTIAQDPSKTVNDVPFQSTVSYKYLKSFEGLYEYVDHSTIKLAASPKDTLLYAIINESRYKLVAVEQDLFQDMTGATIKFFRNKNNEIAGYYKASQTFKLLNKQIQFPVEMWYPRLPAKNKTPYRYQPPKNINDGLSIGRVDSTVLNKLLLEQMMLKIIDGQYPNVHSILIIKDSKLVFEEYFYEHHRGKLHELRSATKSFVSALAGITIDKGFIKNQQQKVLSFFPETNFANESEAKKNITIENLLTNQSGLDCDVSNPNSVGNETTMNNSNDWVKFTLDLPMSDTSGGKGMYCSGNPIVLGKIIEKTTKQSLPDFAKNNLFTPLGIKNFEWNFKPDRSSSETFCQLYLTSRDMAKFGLLYLNNGKWNGRQVISEKWVNQSFQKYSVVQGVNYGYLWWNKYLEVDGIKYYSFAAQGNGGQKIYIWRELNLIVVTTGGNYNSQSPSDDLIRNYILSSFSKK